MKVLWLTFIPSPYRCAFFEELSKYCELTVLFERAKSNLRGNNWDDFQFKGYIGTIMSGITIGGHDRFCLAVRSYLLDKSFDVIVISNPTSPTGIYAASVLKKRKIPYLIESDGAFPTKGKGIKMRIKQFVMGSAEACFSTAKLHDEYYMECGVKKENIYKYPFTSFGESDLATVKKWNAYDQEEMRKKLNISEKKMILSVGRFSYNAGYGKGYDTLLKVSEKLGSDYGIYIVGDNPTQEFCDWKINKGLNQVHFVGFKNKEELAEYYSAADLFALLTRGDVWGLVINEAMMYGLPIITTEKCIAGLELVQEGENGYIIPVDDVEKLEMRIKDILLLESQKYEAMRAKSESIIRRYTYEEMAKVHIQVFKTILEKTKLNIEGKNI